VRQGQYIDRAGAADELGLGEGRWRCGLSREKKRKKNANPTGAGQQVISLVVP
jgi:hypothetical protein